MADDVKQSREDFQEARRALVDKVVAANPGLSHQHFDGVKIADFDTHAEGLTTQIAAQDREAAARFLGISVEELDARKEKEAAGGEESTPQSRTAALPAGSQGGAKPPPLSAPVTTTLTETDLIEAAANEFLSQSGYLTRG
jgi:hypothetical protein